LEDLEMLRPTSNLTAGETKQYVNDKLSEYIVIASSRAFRGQRKRFLFQPLSGDYIVELDLEKIEIGPATELDRLVQVFNET
jgi:hypothetical protein